MENMEQEPVAETPKTTEAVVTPVEKPAEQKTAPAKKVSLIGIIRTFYKEHKKNTHIVLGAIVVLGLLFLGKSLFIAAIVNGVPISRWSVIQELEKNSGQQALDIIITKKLIETAADKQGVSVSEADIDTEIQTIEEEVSKQGVTLDIALAQQGITTEQLREQITLQKKLEKILEDKLAVSDEEVGQYLAQSKTPLPTGMSDADFKNQIREQLKKQKFNVEADKWITSIKGSADIQYYVGYGKPPVATMPAEMPASTETQE